MIASCRATGSSRAGSRPLMGRNSSTISTTGPGLSTQARSITFCSSRMLPGQAYRSSRAMLSGGGWNSSGTAASIRGAGIVALASMREGAVYTIGILAPLVALALVAALGGETSRRVSELPNGGFVDWIYPRSAVREVVAYAGVALWSLRELRRRTSFGGRSGERR